MEKLGSTTHPMLLAMLTTSDPGSLKEVVGGTEKDKWMSAMECDMDLFTNKRVMNLIPLPSDKKTIGCCWCYRTKPLTDNTLKG